MIPDLGASAATPPKKTLLPLLCIGLWDAAAVSARVLGIWTAVGGAAIALGIAVLVLDGAAARKLLRPRPGLVLTGAGVGIAMAATTWLLYPLFTRIAPLVARDTALLYSAFRAPSLGVVSLALLPIVLGEELVWRGVVQTLLVRRFGPPGGVALAAGVYALAHAPLGSPVLVLVALACGLCWGTLRAATGSLVPTLLAHMVWDAVVMLWLPLISR